MTLNKKDFGNVIKCFEYLVNHNKDLKEHTITSKDLKEYNRCFRFVYGFVHNLSIELESLS